MMHAAVIVILGIVAITQTSFIARLSRNNNPIWWAAMGSSAAIIVAIFLRAIEP